MLNIFKSLLLTEEDTAEIVEIRKILIKEIPPERTTEKANLLSVNKVTRIIERAAKKIIEYKDKQKIGRIRWLKLINELRWSLQNAGYSKDFVSLVAEAVIAKSLLKNRDGV